MMRIQVVDGCGQPFTITSSDPQVLGAWFAEMMPVICSADTRYNHPVSIDVWPSTEAERASYGNGSTMRGRQGKAAWLDLIEYMGKIADAMPDTFAAEET